VISRATGLLAGDAGVERGRSEGDAAGASVVPSRPFAQFPALQKAWRIRDNLWSVRVTISIRAVGHRDGDTIIWVWIGPHGQFDSKFG